MKLAFSLMKRELRGGLRDFRLLLGCLMIGTFVIAMVGSLSARIETGIREQARSLLGGDVELTQSNVPFPPEVTAFLASYGRVSITLDLRAMAGFGDAATLAELRVVDSAYPLSGAAELASKGTLSQAFAAHAILVEQSLLDRLNAKPGDSITLGDARFTVGGVILKEPDRIAGAFSLGPHVLARYEDIRDSGLLLPGGLVHYHAHLLLGDTGRLAAFRSALLTRFPKAAWTLKTYNENNRTVQNLVDRLQFFMTLVGLSALLIGGVGMLSAMESYMRRKQRSIAILKTLGARRGLIFSTYLGVIFLVAFTGALVSADLGGIAAYAASPWLADYFPLSRTASLPAAPLLLAAGFGLATVLAFCVPAIGRGVESRPTVLFRGETAEKPPLSRKLRLLTTALVALLAGLLIASARDTGLAVGFIFAAFATFGIFALAARFFRYLPVNLVRTSWARLAIRQLQSPGAHNFSVLLSIGIGLTVLIAILLVEGNFERQVNETLPSRAPSAFFIDIQPSELAPFLAWLKSTPGVSDVDATSMVRGRIARLKGVRTEDAPIDEAAKWATESDRGFSAKAAVAGNAKDGPGWDANYRGPVLASVDRSLAKGMHLGIGDMLTLNILGRDVEAKVAHLRDVDYTNFHINFAVLLSPGALDGFTATAIATAHIEGDANEAGFVRASAKRFPNISVIRIKESIAQLAEIVGQIAVALRLTALAVLLSGVMVLAAAMGASLHARAHDLVVLKICGARRGDLLKSFLFEWGIVALVTGILASVLGAAGAWLILARFHWTDFQLLPGAFLKALLLTFALIALTGAAMQFRLFKARPSYYLRNE